MAIRRRGPREVPGENTAVDWQASDPPSGSSPLHYLISIQSLLGSTRSAAAYSAPSTTTGSANCDSGGVKPCIYIYIYIYRERERER